MKVFFWAVFLSILIGCNNKQSKFINEKIARETNENKIIDSLGCSDLLTEAKWKFYLKYCNAIIDKDDNSQKITKPKYVGEADIYLFSAKIYSDTLLGILFDVVINDTLEVNKDYQLENKYFKDKYYTWYFFNVKNKTLYGYGRDIAIIRDTVKLNDYCNEIPNCNKKKFIKGNKHILNKWFVREAIRRKYIEE